MSLDTRLGGIQVSPKQISGHRGPQNRKISTFFRHKQGGDPNATNKENGLYPDPKSTAAQ